MGGIAPFATVAWVLRGVEHADQKRRRARCSELLGPITARRRCPTETERQGVERLAAAAALALGES